MLTEIQIKNFKSIEDEKISLGRVNVFIGANGAGKSNLLEAIALAGAASADKLDNEFLSSRGIRATDAKFMRSAFSGYDDNRPIEIKATNDKNTIVTFKINNDNEEYSNWTFSKTIENAEEDSLSTNLPHWLRDYIDAENGIEPTKLKEAKVFFDFLSEVIKKSETGETSEDDSELEKLAEKTVDMLKGSNLLENFQKSQNSYSEISSYLKRFIIYSPENSSLKTLEKEGQIQPLGINGEGLFKLLMVLNSKNPEGILSTIKENMKMLGWFEDFSPVETSSEYKLEITDRFLDKDRCVFDQKSVNEGFLFLAFYFSLFTSPITPAFFAIDNIDVSLNPNICQKLIRQLVVLAKKNGKQVILTTHNPATLDGLNLEDEDQRLFAISRSREGKTKVKRIEKPRKFDNAPEPRLSEMFLRGMIGGLSKGF